MAKYSPPSVSSPSISSDQQPWLFRTQDFLGKLGISGDLPAVSDKKGQYSDLIRGLLKVDRIERGHVACTFEVKDTILNGHNTLHGGFVSAVAEAVALACARTVAAENKELVLGELSLSFLSAAALKMEVEVEGCIVRHGRNIIVTAIEFRVKKTRKLTYTARATFYNMPLASM